MFAAETRDAENLLPCPLLLYPFFPSQWAVELGVSLDPFFSLTKQIYLYSKQPNAQHLLGLRPRCWTKLSSDGGLEGSLLT